ncbi:MAG: hypothetical protein Q4B52_08105 [Tissierellia bacterium]|nr:hypothetical protein [Tissierellia bacterium]
MKMIVQPKDDFLKGCNIHGCGRYTCVNYKSNCTTFCYKKGCVGFTCDLCRTLSFCNTDRTGHSVGSVSSRR